MLLERLHFNPPDVHVLADGPCMGQNFAPGTKQNIMAGIRSLLMGAGPGDMLYFMFAGHGTQVPDADGDEEDGMDEAIVPADFFTTKRLITDDELSEALVDSLHPGALLTAFFDCCHSGTILDLDSVADGTDGLLKKAKNKKKKTTRHLDWGDAIPRGIPPVMDYVSDFIRNRSMGPKPPAFCYSGCRDDQTSLDVTVNGRPCGAMTTAVMQALEDIGHENPYSDLFESFQEQADVLRTKFRRMDQCIQFTYNDCADPDEVNFVRLPSSGFQAAAPAPAPEEPPKKFGKDKKGKKDKKDKKEKTPKGKKEKKDKKGGKKDKKTRDFDDSDSSDSDDARVLSPTANAGMQILAMALGGRI